MKVIGLIAVFIIIALIDIPTLTKKAKAKGKYFIVYGLIVIVGFTISLLQVINKEPASPSRVIERIIKGIIGEL